MAILKIKDNPADINDTQPSVGTYWSQSDIQIFHDTEIGLTDLTGNPPTITFDPTLPAQVDASTNNYVIIRVTDVTPGAVGGAGATNLDISSVNARIVPANTLSGLTYPASWQTTTENLNNYIVLQPASGVNGYNRNWNLDVADDGAPNFGFYKEAYFVFEINTNQRDNIVSWPSHPCLIAEVVNDTADPVNNTSNLLVNNRRLAQRNLSVIPLPPPPPPPPSPPPGGGGGEGSMDPESIPDPKKWSEYPFFGRGLFPDLPFFFDPMPRTRFVFLAGSKSDPETDFALNIRQHVDGKSPLTLILAVDDGNKYFRKLDLGLARTPILFLFIKHILLKIITLFIPFKPTSLPLKQRKDFIAVNAVNDGTGFMMGGKRFILLTSSKSTIQFERTKGSTLAFTLYAAFKAESKNPITVDVSHLDRNGKVIGGLTGIFSYRRK